jgi:hypothetical protein
MAGKFMNAGFGTRCDVVRRREDFGDRIVDRGGERALYCGRRFQG